MCPGFFHVVHLLQSGVVRFSWIGHPRRIANNRLIQSWERIAWHVAPGMNRWHNKERGKRNKEPRVMGRPGLTSQASGKLWVWELFPASETHIVVQQWHSSWRCKVSISKQKAAEVFCCSFGKSWKVPASLHYCETWRKMLKLCT